MAMSLGFRLADDDGTGPLLSKLRVAGSFVEKQRVVSCFADVSRS